MPNNTMPNNAILLTNMPNDDMPKPDDMEIHLKMTNKHIITFFPSKLASYAYFMNLVSEIPF